MDMNLHRQRRRTSCVLLFTSIFVLFLTSLNILFLDRLNLDGNASLNDEAMVAAAAAVITKSKTIIQQKVPKATIAYTIAVTSCSDASDMRLLLEGAAVLKHSIHRSSIRYSPNNNINNNGGSSYDYRMIAFVHDPDALQCAPYLTNLGYEVQSKQSLVRLDEIRNQDYAKIIQDSGCCGEKEFLKLYAYNLTEYPAVVQLDIDNLILKPLDPLFDALLEQDNDEQSLPSSSSFSAMNYVKDRYAMWRNHSTTRTSNDNNNNNINNNSPTKINAFFTRDYNSNLIYKQAHKMIPPHRLQVQGGFLVVRPNASVLMEYIELIKTGDFVPFRGWTPQGWGGIRKGSGGSDRFQGLVSYYYSGIHPGDALELNHCYYNQNAGKPRVNGKCTTMATMDDCEDCRKTNASDIYSFHFGGCRKPWQCPFFGPKQPDAWKSRGMACVKMHREWHKIRNDLESTLLYNNNNNTTTTSRYNTEIDSFLELDSSKNITDFYLGHCRKNEEAAFGYEYLPMNASLIYT